MAPSAAMAASPMNMPMMMNEGGALKDVDAEENPGLAKLPTHVRNKMGFKKNGGKAC